MARSWSTLLDDARAIWQPSLNLKERFAVSPQVWNSQRLRQAGAAAQHGEQINDVRENLATNQLMTLAGKNDGIRGSTNRTSNPPPKPPSRWPAAPSTSCIAMVRSRQPYIALNNTNAA
jgi:hypothetical protein